MKKRIGLLLFVVLVLSPFVLPSQNIEFDRQLPGNEPEKGLIYDGLEVARDGSCKGALRLKGLVLPRELCTEGPDLAPANMNPLASIPPLARTEQPFAATTTVTCDGDGTSGKRVQLIYAHAATAPDRFSTYQTSIQQWAAEVDLDFNISASQTGGTRHVRFVHDASCTPNVADVALSANGAGNFSSMINDLSGQGYSRIDRKYLVFVDARVYCGISNIAWDDQPGAANQNNLGRTYARVDTGCWSGVIAAHELMHTLGGVQMSAPHSDFNYHCNQGYDNMCDHSGHAVTIVCPDTAGDSWFDCNHDDYYSTNPPVGSYLATHWNTANNQFLFATGVPPSSTTPTATATSSATPMPTAPPTATPTRIPGTATPVLTPTPTSTYAPLMPTNTPTPCLGTLGIKVC